MADDNGGGGATMMIVVIALVLMVGLFAYFMAHKAGPDTTIIQSPIPQVATPEAPKAPAQ